MINNRKFCSTFFDVKKLHIYPPPPPRELIEASGIARGDAMGGWTPQSLTWAPPLLNHGYATDRGNAIFLANYSSKFEFLYQFFLPFSRSLCKIVFISLTANPSSNRFIKSKHEGDACSSPFISINAYRLASDMVKVDGKSATGKVLGPNDCKANVVVNTTTTTKGTSSIHLTKFLSFIFTVIGLAVCLLWYCYWLTDCC